MTSGRTEGIWRGVDGAADPGVAASTILRGSAWDIGVPAATYYALHLIGVAEWPALLAATLVAGARVVWAAVRGHAANPLAMVTMIVLGAGLALTFVTLDARFLLVVRASIMTAAVGIMFVVMAALGHPLTLDAAKIYEPEKAAWRSEQFRTNPAVRHGYRTVSVVWGTALLAEAVVLVPLIYLLPVDVMVAVSAVIGIGLFVALAGWTGWYQQRARQALPGTGA